MHGYRRHDLSGNGALVVPMTSPLMGGHEPFTSEHAINIVRCARRQPGEHHTAVGNSTKRPSDTGADGRSTGISSPFIFNASKKPMSASSACFTASSYDFPHVLQPGSAGKDARYPSSWRSISSV